LLVFQVEHMLTMEQQWAVLAAAALAAGILRVAAPVLFIPVEGALETMEALALPVLLEPLAALETPEQPVTPVTQELLERLQQR
jgi:hypothetical protein